MKLVKKRILVGDNSKEFLDLIKQHKDANSFCIEVTTKGGACLEKIKTFHPHLVIAEFMLSEVHGIELLKAAKNSSSIHKTGFILTCYHALLQNYKAAIHFGADYFLEKPFSINHLFDLIHLFFEEKLHPIPFKKEKNIKVKVKQPKIKLGPSSYLKFWGTRGSNPVAGLEYVRFGGNTPCLEVRHGKDLVIIDAGSGIRSLGQVLKVSANTKLNILLSHTHWDHLLGFPFFYPIHQAKCEVHVWAPIGFEKTTKELFFDMLAYSYFPVSFEDIRSKLFFEDLRDSQVISFGRIKVATHYAFHPGPTLCFKIQVKNKVIGYVTDNEFLQGCQLPLTQIEKKEDLFTPYHSFIQFLTGCDILIHEAQYLPNEYLSKEGWGHSSLYNASLLIKKAKIRHWIIVHHDPKHTDEMLLEKHLLHIKALEEIGHECQVQMGYDGMMIPLE